MDSVHYGAGFAFLAKNTWNKIREQNAKHRFNKLVYGSFHKAFLNLLITNLGTALFLKTVE